MSIRRPDERDALGFAHADASTNANASNSVDPAGCAVDAAEHVARAHARRDWPRVRRARALAQSRDRSEEHTSELQSPCNLVCRLLLEKKQEVDGSDPSASP